MSDNITQNEGTPSAASTVDITTGTSTDTKPFDARTDIEKLDEGTKKYIEKLRAENAQRRTEAQQAKALVEKLQEERKQAEAAQLAEQGRYKELYEKEVQSSKSKNEKLMTSIKMAEIKLHLQQEGAVDPEILSKAVDLSSVRIDEETGDVVGADTAVASLKAQKPVLFNVREPEPAAAPAPASTSAGTGAPGAGTSTPGPKSVVALSRQDYRKQLDDLRANLRRK